MTKKNPKPRNNASIPGKGHNEILEIVNPLEHTTAATEAFDVHVPGNGGT
jgi:hypothetical protein